MSPISPPPPKLSIQRGRQRPADAWWAVAVCGFLVVAVLIAFSPALRQGFLNWDDNFFVTDEPHVSGGLSLSGIVWAFTNGPYGEWFPLSMLSHMLDCQLYGLNPVGHHVTNILLHAATAVTLFLVLWRMTSALWPSALVAALFALHPLRVESVAWVAERRDVLSGLFFMLTLGAYGEYARNQSLRRYLAVVVLFAMGLMSKSILLTLPPLLLLLDYWPLGRFLWAEPELLGRNAPPAPFPWWPILDKLPLFALAIAAAGVTMHTHSAPQSDPLTLPERLANAAVSSAAYLGQLFVPVGLSPFYSHPEAGRPVLQVAAAAALLIAITATAVIGRRAYPYFFVGWFWYVGMLLPVLGLTYVGASARADRYTYLSQIGIDIALVWGAAQLGVSWPARHWIFGTSSALVLAVLMAGTWRQTRYWQDDKTLWEHALACDPKNVRAHYELGTALEATDESAAVAQYQRVLEMDPHERNINKMVRAKAQNWLGDIAARKGDITDAIGHYEQALELEPNFALAHTNLGSLLATNGDFDEAMAHFQRSFELEPDAKSLCCMAVAQSQQGKTDEAIANLRKALKTDPSYGPAHVRLAFLLTDRNEADDAIFHFRRAIELDPDVVSPYSRIAQLLRNQGKTTEAAKYEDLGKKASRRYAEGQNRRGTELAQQGKLDDAIAQFESAVAFSPDYVQAHCNLADALALQGNIDGAVMHYRRALDIDPNFAPAKRSLERLLNR